MKLKVTGNKDYLEEFDIPIENAPLFAENKKVSFDGESIYRVKLSWFDLKENALHIDVQKLATIDNYVKGFI